MEIVPLVNAPPTPENNHRVATDDRLNKLWTLQERLRLAQQIDSNLPYFSHSIAVSVVGGPKADMQRIWALCLSTAFGRYRQAGLQGFQAADLDAVWDITGKACQVQMSYVNSGFIGTALNLASSTGATGSYTDFIVAGPTQETVGGRTASWINADLVIGAVAGAAAVGGLVGRVIGGRFGDSQTGAAIGSLGFGAQALLYANLIRKASGNGELNLPDSGRIITTANKVNPNLQPPRPPGDNFSRTFPYVALVANALTEPGYLPAAPPLPDKTPPVPVYIPLDGPRGLTNSRLAGQAINLPTPIGVNALASLFGGLAVANEALKTLAAPRGDGYPSLPPAAADLRGITNRLGTTY
jgi:hypothetical protein